MSDMLVKLYDFPDKGGRLDCGMGGGIVIRKPMGPEKHLCVRWVRRQFGPGWASEADTALSNRPASCFIAVRRKRIVGFSCYDCTSLGMFGPIGVEKRWRRRGVGRGLLVSSMLDMKLRGYSYVIIGNVTPAAWYESILGAVEIPDSSPGLLRTLVTRV